MVKWLSVLLLFWAARAEATYSIAGVDTATGEVGGAGTSCVGNFSVSVIYGSAPGFGVVHAQSYYNEAARDRAVELLEQGDDPESIISAITSLQFDPGASTRQYGVATIDGATAAFTGDDCGQWAGHVEGAVDRFAYTAQGNILTSEAVVTNAAAAFEGDGCDLAERLMLALEAGAMNGEGDARCTPDGIPSDGAFIRVDRAGDPRWLDLRVDDTAPMNPLSLLREEFDQWRVTHGCPPPPPPPDAGVVEVGAPDMGTSKDAGADAGADDASGLLDASDPTPARETGCGCTATEPHGPALIAGLAVIGAIGQRRRRR